MTSPFIVVIPIQAKVLRRRASAFARTVTIA